MTPEEIIEEYPQLTPEDIFAALAYAAEVTDGVLNTDKFLGGIDYENQKIGA